MEPWGYKVPQWRSCGPAELECAVGDQNSMLLMEGRWSKDGGQGCVCAGTAGLWGR